MKITYDKWLETEQQKMKASADELQAIIDEAWKNPEFQEASKN